MKRFLPFLLLSLTCLAFQNSAQTESKWQFSAGAGVNALRLYKGGGKTNWVFISSEERVTLSRIGNKYGFQANAGVGYYLGRRWQLRSGMGLTYAHALTYRRIDEDGMFLGFPSHVTYWDTIDQKFLLGELPIYARWHVVAPDNEQASMRLFFDMGITYQFPLVNRSTFSRRSDNGADSSGEIKLRFEPGYMLGFGFLMGEKYALTLHWSGFRSNEKESVRFSSTLTRLTLSRFF